MWCVRERLPLLLFGEGETAGNGRAREGETAGQTIVAAWRRRDLVEDETQDLPKQLIVGGERDGTPWDETHGKRFRGGRGISSRISSRTGSRRGRDGLGHGKGFRGERGERLR